MKKHSRKVGTAIILPQFVAGRIDDQTKPSGPYNNLRERQGKNNNDQEPKR